MPHTIDYYRQRYYDFLATEEVGVLNSFNENKVMNGKTYKKYKLWCLISAITGLREGETFYLAKLMRF
jgi:hypothetical protein